MLKIPLVQILFVVMAFASGFLLARFAGLWRVLFISIATMAAVLVICFPSRNPTLAWVGSMALWAVILLGPVYLAGLIFGNFSHGIWAENGSKSNAPSIQSTSRLNTDEPDEKT
ncbi:MAG: hypothetical protein U1C96_07965 [Gallionella sp.]|nr:hypothetical protein [Gallionella sp.]